jgi:5-methylcytosine-specific restriction enzyme subunit McrC
LREHQPSEPLLLYEQELAEVLSVASLTLEPTGRPDEYVITPGSEVGALEFKNLSLVIEPKLPIDRVLFLVSYALDPSRWKDTDVSLPSHAGLVEAVIHAFVAHARRAFARGVLQGYRTEEDSSLVVRGRILFDEQLRRRFGKTPPAEVRFDDFTEDIELNRLVKAATRRLARLRIRSASSRRSLNVIESALERVRHVEYHPRHLPDVTFSRLNSHYRPLILLSKVILRSKSLELGYGEARASGFLLDMNRVFEDFVVAALREALGVSAREFPQGASCPPLYLARDQRVRLRPDVSWWELERLVFVGDVKYKRLTLSGYQNADLYQLLAYCTAAALPGGILIYAKGERPEANYVVRHADKVLHVAALSLDGAPEEVLNEIRHIAKLVRTLRRDAVGSIRLAG